MPNTSGDVGAVRRSASGCTSDCRPCRSARMAARRERWGQSGNRSSTPAFSSNCSIAISVAALACRNAAIVRHIAQAEPLRRSGRDRDADDRSRPSQGELRRFDLRLAATGPCLGLEHAVFRVAALAAPGRSLRQSEPACTGPDFVLGPGCKDPMMPQSASSMLNIGNSTTV